MKQIINSAKTNLTTEYTRLFYEKIISLCALSLLAFSYMFLGARTGNRYIRHQANARLLENFLHANHNVNQSISTPSVVDPETSADLADEAEDIACPICFASAQRLTEKHRTLATTTCCKQALCLSCIHTIIARRNNCPFCRAEPLEYTEENTNTIPGKQPENNASTSRSQPSSVENTQTITESSSHPEPTESQSNHNHSATTPYHWVHRYWDLG